MKKRLKLLLTVGLALGAISTLGYLGIAAPPDIPNLVQYHKITHDPAYPYGLITSAPGADSATCIACHGDKRVEASLSNYYKSAHKTHNTSVYLTFNLLTPTDNDGDGEHGEDPPGDADSDPLDPPAGADDDDGDGLIDEDGVESECAKCHYQTDTSLGIQTVDERGDLILTDTERSFEGGLLDDIGLDWSLPVGNDSARVARKQVDPDLCLSCHGGFVMTTDPVDSHNNRKALDPRGCKLCHDFDTASAATDPRVSHRQVPYVNLRYSETRISCMKCHGGYQWYKPEETNPQKFGPYWPQDAHIVP